MRIMHTDNFGGDYPDEKFVEGLPNLDKDRMQKIADAINTQQGPDAARYYKVVPNDYKLQPGFEP